MMVLLLRCIAVRVRCLLVASVLFNTAKFVTTRATRGNKLYRIIILYYIAS